MMGRRSLYSSLLPVLLTALFFLSSCATTVYDREFINVEDRYYDGEYEQAVQAVRALADTAGKKELLLYSMEAGVIFHTMGDLESSNRAFQQADEISQSISRDRMEEIAAFWLNDNSKKFIGQNFERVLIKYYMVLNTLAAGDLENAKVLFRQIDYELREMKFFDELYKQNGAARFLDALVSENLGEYNDSRVQLKNLRTMFPEREAEIGAAQYVLAVEEGRREDQERFQQWADSMYAFNSAGARVPYRKGMAEIVLLNYAGQAAVKNSRGRIKEEPRLMEAFHTSLSARPELKDSMNNLMNILMDAENPIPEYVRRDPTGSRRVEVALQGKPVGRTQPFFSYSETVMQNFNDHYSDMIDKNIDSLSAKIAGALAVGETAAVAANLLNTVAAAKGSSDQVDVDDTRQAGVAIAASQIYQSIAPDLRCWRLLPDNYQLMRIFVEPGEYSLDVLTPGDAHSTWNEKKLVLGEEDFRFISFQTMSPDSRRYRLVGGEADGEAGPEASQFSEDMGDTSGAAGSREASAGTKTTYATRSVEVDIASFIDFAVKAASFPMHIDDADKDKSVDTTIFTGDLQENLAGNFGLGFRYHFGLHGDYTGVGTTDAVDTTVLRFNGELEARYTILGRANQGLWAGGGMGMGIIGIEETHYSWDPLYEDHDEIETNTDSETFSYGLLSAGYRGVLGSFSFHPYMSFKFGSKAALRMEEEDRWAPSWFRAGFMIGRSY